MKLTYNSHRKSSFDLFFRLYSELKRLVAAINRDYTCGLEDSRDLRVWRTIDRDGGISWNAYDPKTEKKIRGVSEEQVLAWIEGCYYS